MLHLHVHPVLVPYEYPSACLFHALEKQVTELTTSAYFFEIRSTNSTASCAQGLRVLVFAMRNAALIFLGCPNFVDLSLVRAMSKAQIPRLLFKLTLSRSDQKPNKTQYVSICKASRCCCSSCAEANVSSGNAF